MSTKATSGIRGGNLSMVCPFSSLRPSKNTSRSALDMATTERTSRSTRHSSDQVLTGWPVSSEIAVG
jgi:hypothetical protein